MRWGRLRAWRERQSPSLTPEQARQVAFEVKIAAATFLLHSFEQLKHIPTAPPVERAQRLASLPLTAALFILPLALPGFYIVHRDAFLFVWKLAFFSAPLLRSSKGIQRVLATSASPGARGFLGDLIKMAWGSRLFATALSGVSLPVSRWWAQLAVQAFATSRVLSNDSLCTTQLVTDPKTVHRLASMAAVTCDALLPWGALAATVEGRECAFAIVLLHMVFAIVAPTLLVLPGVRRFWQIDARSKLSIMWLLSCFTWLLAAVLTAHVPF